MFKKASLQVLLALLVGTGFESGGAVAGPVPAAKAVETPVPEKLVGLRERWQSAMTDLDVPGLAVVVVRDGKVIYTETLGVRDPEKKLPVTPDTIFYIASCTKSFIAMAVMSLVEEGKVSLDAPVKKYLPKFEMADSSLTETVSVRDLLSHGKGLQSGPIVWLDAYSGEITETRFYRWLKDAKARGSFEYSNLHYTLLGRIVETVTGTSWKDFLDERIFQSAGMTRTTAYASRMYTDADAALPCEVENDKLVATRVRKTDRTMHAAGGLGASINDLGRWLQLNLGKGTIQGHKILSSEGAVGMWDLHAKANSPMTRGPRTREGYGFGWALGPYSGKRMVEHGGGYTGSAAFVSFLPEEGIGVAVVVNTSTPLAEQIAFDVYNRLLGLDVEDDLPSVVKRGKDRRQRQATREKSFSQKPVVASRLSMPIERYVGMYEHADWGALVVESHNGQLSARSGDLTFRLRSTAQDAFDADPGTGDVPRGRFEVAGDEVVAVVITLDEQWNAEPRFVRK